MMLRNVYDRSNTFRAQNWACPQDPTKCGFSLLTRAMPWPRHFISFGLHTSKACQLPSFPFRPTLYMEAEGGLRSSRDPETWDSVIRMLRIAAYSEKKV